MSTAASPDISVRPRRFLIRAHPCPVPCNKIPSEPSVRRRRAYTLDAFFNNYLLHCRVASQCTSKAGLDVTTQSDCPPPLPLPGPRTTPLPATGDCHAPPTYLPSTLSTPEQPYTGPSPPKKPNLSQVLKSVTPPPPLPGLLPQSEVGLVNHFYYF